jgi:hypothetical protein
VGAGSPAAFVYEPTSMVDKLPIFRTRAALRQKIEQLEAMSAEMKGLREQLSEMTALKRAFEKSSKLLETHRRRWYRRRTSNGL